MSETTQKKEKADSSELNTDQPVETHHQGESSNHQADPIEQIESGGYEDSVEPTRFGDWEIAGRCIDF